VLRRLCRKIPVLVLVLVLVMVMMMALVPSIVVEHHEDTTFIPSLKSESGLRTRSLEGPFSRRTNAGSS
jgi:peptidoglycan/LPS O-acetylase OafA/YrhL